MKKLKKWVVRLVLGGLALLIVTVSLTWLYLDRLAARALTTGLQWTANVHSEVGSVSLSPFSGHIDVDALMIGNPPSYKAGELLRVGQAHAKVDFRTIWQGPVQVDVMEIDRPVVRLEGGPGGSNVQVFMESFQGKPAAPTTSPGTPSGTPPMRIRVSKLVIRNATLQVCQIDAPQKDVPVKLIEMQNVCGLDGAGMTAAELSGMIVSELVRRGAAQGDINMAELFRPDVSRAMEAMLITGGCVLAPMSGQALTQPFESVLRLANPKRK